MNIVGPGTLAPKISSTAFDEFGYSSHTPCVNVVAGAKRSRTRSGLPSLLSVCKVAMVLLPWRFSMSYQVIYVMVTGCCGNVLLS